MGHVWHYLNDFITIGTTGSGECAFNCQLMSHMCGRLGIPLAPDKCEGLTMSHFPWDRTRYNCIRGTPPKGEIEPAKVSRRVAVRGTTHTKGVGLLSRAIATCSHSR